jgi:hypothetical protein
MLPQNLFMHFVAGNYLGVQGYLRVTACLVPDGAEPKTVRGEILSGDALQDGEHTTQGQFLVATMYDLCGGGSD